MDDLTLLHRLEELAQSLDIDIRYENLESEKANPAGGLCRIRGRHMIIINKNIPLNGKLSALLKALKRFDLSGIYIKPALRELFEKGVEEQ